MTSFYFMPLTNNTFSHIHERFYINLKVAKSSAFGNRSAHVFDSIEMLPANPEKTPVRHVFDGGAFENVDASSALTESFAGARVPHRI